jgi:spore coat protein CotH
MLSKVALSLFFSVQTVLLIAQLNPPDAPVLFREDAMQRIDIFIDPDTLDILLEDLSSDHEYQARFVYNNFSDICDTIENIGFRVRGNISRIHEKKSFKVSFNTYERGRKYYGLEKMNLKSTSDDSFLRPKLAWKVCRGMGIPASWVSHVILYINNELWGIYENTEHIDEEYVQKVFGNKDGNLYKCRFPASLEFRTYNPDDYKFENSYYVSRMIRVYELKTNTRSDNYTDLMEFIAELDDNSGTDFRERISKRINIVSLLKFFAIEVYLGHWDSYSYNVNNYYLYHNQQSDQFEYITYDMDLTMGIRYGGPHVLDLDIYNYIADPVSRPLRKNILDVEEFRDYYTFFLRQLTQRFPPDSLLQYALKVQDYIAPFVEQDPFYYYTMPEFFGALYNPLGRAEYGVIDYLENSYSKILEQLQNSNTKPIIHNLYYSNHFSKDTITVNCTVEDDDEAVQVQLCYEFNDGELISIPMLKVSEGELMGMAYYAAKIDPFEEAGVLKFYIKATDSQQQVSTNPYSGRHTLNVFTDPPALISVTDNVPQLTLYPNPATDFVTLQLTEPGQILLLVDLNGIILKQYSLKGESSITIDARHLTPGVYLVRVITEKQQMRTLKLIKE